MNRSLHMALALSVMGVFAQLQAHAQCPQVLDPDGSPTDSPTWASCYSEGPELELTPAADWSGVLVNWGDGSPVETVTWVAGDAPLVHVYPDGAAAYAVSIDDAAAGCTVSGTFDVIPPQANLTSGASQVCEGGTVNFMQTGTGGGQNYWNFGVGSTFIPTSNGVVSYLFSNPGVTTITNIYVSDLDPVGCRDTSTVDIVVKPRPELEISLSTLESCGPTFVSGAASGVDLQNVVWSFATAPYFVTGMEMPLTYFSNIGSNPISATGMGTNGCNVSLAQTVNIYPEATVAITAATGSACEGETAQFEGVASVPMGQSISDITWDFGDGNTQTGLTAEHVFTDAGTYPVALTVETNLCTSTINETITIESSPEVTLTASEVTGCAPLDVSFMGTVVGASTYALDLGNGNITTDLNAVHTFAAADHEVVLQAQSSNGCAASASLTVASLAPATVAVVNAPDAACGDLAFQLESVVSGAYSLQWEATNGWNSTETMPLFSLINATDEPMQETVTVTALASNGCDASAQIQVEVLPMPDYSFTLAADTACSPLQVNLPAIGDATTFTWDFGDGTTSAEAAPTHTFANDADALASFDVTFEGTNAYGCSNTATRQVHVKPQPQADFTLSAVAGCEPLEVTFENASALGTTYTLTTTSGEALSVAAGEQVDLSFAAAGGLTQFDVQLTAAHALGCVDARTESVEVYPNPVFDLGPALEAACTPYTVNFTTPADATYASWSFGDGSTAASMAPSHTFENTSNDLVTYTVNMAGENIYGCTGTASVAVPVKPVPVADFSISTDAGCAPLELTVLNTSSTGATYTFATGNGTTWSMEPSESHDMTLAGLSGVSTEEIQLTVVHALGCEDTQMRTVTVFPEAQFDFDLATDSACSPMTVALPALPEAASLTWTFGDGSTAGASATEHTFENPTDDLASFTVALVGETVHGCTDTHEATVHVKPQPVANFSLNADAGCAPFQVTATNASSLGTTYVFSTDAGLVYPVQADGNQSFSFAGGDQPETRTIMMTAVHALGCTDVRTQTVEVLPQATFTFELGVDSVCSPLEFTAPTIPGASAVTWRFDNGMAINDPEAAMTFANASMDLETHTIELEAENAYGCSNTAAQEVHVKPQPVADFSLSDHAGCAPFQVILTNTSTQADAYHWDYGDDHVLNTGISGAHSYVFEGEEEPVVRTVKLTASHVLGCMDEKLDTLEVFPQAVAMATGITFGCTPFEAALAYEGGEADQIQWTLNGIPAGSNTDFTTTLTEGGEATLALTVATPYGCVDSLNVPLTAFATPEIELSLEADAACAGTPLELTHAVTGADDVTVAFSNGATLSAPEADSEVIQFENPYANPSTVTITQTATTAAGCTATAEIQHTVYPDADAGFEVPEGACAPFDGLLVNLSSDADAFAWNIGGVVTSAVSPLHTFTNASSDDTEVPVTLVATNGFGCADTLTQAVTVFGTPAPTLAVTNVTNCYPVVATFEATGGVSSVWIHGDEDPVAESGLAHTHTFFNAYDQPVEVQTTVEVANEHGCTATASAPIQLVPELTAQFDVIEEGCTPLELNVVNQSAGASGYMWSFGDGATSTAANPMHTLVNDTPNDQTFVVELLAVSGNGCTDTIAVGVLVHPEPEANFFATPIEQTYPNTSVAFTNLSTSGAEAVHTWTFGDGGSTNDFAPGVHNYGTWGTFDVTLDVDNGYCDHAVTQTVTIHPPAPTVAFSGEAEGCAPVDVAFTNESEYAASVLWDFGDGATSTELDPVHQYAQPGVYDVTLRVTGHQGLVTETVHHAVVTVLPSPTALFEFEPYEVIAPTEEVHFIDLSSDDAMEYLWNFGDGATSTEQHPRHSYEAAGLYSISLSVRNEFGCTDTHTYVDAITAKPGGFMIFPTAFTPDLTGPSDGSYGLSDLDNDVFHPHHAGIETYELSVFNIWGEMIFRSEDPMIGWDGYINGLLAPQSTYVWKATARFSDGRRLTESGDFTLIIN